MNRRDLLQRFVASAMVTRGLVGQAGPVPDARAIPLILLPVLQPPDLVAVQVGDGDAEMSALARTGDVWWPVKPGPQIEVEVSAGADRSEVAFVAPVTPLQRIHLRWLGKLPETAMVLGDAWERSYGDLAWLPMQAERVLPWYALVHRDGGTSGVGVEVNGGALAFWQIDPAGISLWLDVRNGGCGIRAGKRRVHVATVVGCVGEAGEDAFAVACRLCKVMAGSVQSPARRGSYSTRTIYGSNDWYYAYGRNTEAGILRDADLMAELAPAGAPRPFTVIDDGYQDRKRFPDMARLAEQIRGRGAAPGVWIRPLRAPVAGTGPLLRAKRESPVYDPTLPEGMEAALAVVREACRWGYDLIKHDFTTYELMGQWGNRMGASPTEGTWHFADRSRTNAEIILGLYCRIREAAGEDRLIVGCNTVGHLAAGVFDAQRTGDDVSGRLWERTRRMGVNTLAFRMPQHGRFFSIDADCVPLTPSVPAEQTAAWLDAVARSGTVLLVSPDPRSVGLAQKRMLREAFALCCSGSRARPVDWMESRTPSRWTDAKGERVYGWLPREGAGLLV